MQLEISTLIERNSFWSRVEKYGTHVAYACVSFSVLHQGVPYPASSCFRNDDQIIDVQIRPACQRVDWSHAQDANKFAVSESSNQFVPRIRLPEGSSEKFSFVQFAQPRDNREGLRPFDRCKVSNGYSGAETSIHGYTLVTKGGMVAGRSR